MDARDALADLLRNAGLAAVDAAGASFTGGDPVFRTPYRIGTAGAAALAAVGCAISELWHLKTQRHQGVKVGVRAAAASLRSARYLRIGGKPPAEVWAPLSGWYPVRDGRWLSVHCNFPDHRDAAMRVLGNPADRATAEKASAGWEGVALEDAIHAAGGCAGLARTAEEWARHPQAAAVAAQPLVEIQRIAGSGPEPLPDNKRPLSGVRVLDLTRVLAGPTCARTLAEHGADVLKITAEHLADSGQVDIDTGLGKLSAHVDLRGREGVDTLRGLLRGADVFSQSYRPGALAARGFSPEQAAQLRPGIVCVALSAWGSEGPWSGRRGFDTIVQAVSGMAMKQSNGTKPAYLPASAIDYVSGYLMAFGAITALERRAREGGSWLVRVSLARTGKWITDLGLTEGFASVPGELSAEELRTITTETKSAFGNITHLKPALDLSETPPYWERPPVPLGSSPAQWPRRSSRTGA